MTRKEARPKYDSRVIDAAVQVAMDEYNLILFIDDWDLDSEMALATDKEQFDILESIDRELGAY